MCRRFVVAIAALLLPSASYAGWSVEGYLGSAWSVPSRLAISQAGQPDISLTASWDTKPFYDAPYYGWRVGRWEEGGGWEFELVHHKLYLANPPAEVENFNVSHGYNLLTVNRAWDVDGIIWRAGAGAVVSHPENRIRGESFDTQRGMLGRGFYLSGAALQGSIGKRWHLVRGLFLTLEGKVSAALARVPVTHGHADVPNLAAHLVAGVGYSL